MNGWLMGLAFVLGGVLTALFTIRRATRETPVATASAPEPEPEPVEPEVLAPQNDEPEAPHGPGSARPGTDGRGPEGWTVKGNEESKLYHSPESPSFGVTRAEVWFRDVATAEAAGFNRWDSGKSQRGRRPTS